MADSSELETLDLEVFVTEGLGDSSYLLASGREAVLVDPQRDAWRFLEVAERRGWRVRHVLETHVHNDYLSGALETRAATGAEIVAPAPRRLRVRASARRRGRLAGDRRPAPDRVGDARPHAGAPRLARHRGRHLRRGRRRGACPLQRRQPARRLRRPDGPAGSGAHERADRRPAAVPPRGSRTCPATRASCRRTARAASAAPARFAPNGRRRSTPSWRANPTLALVSAPEEAFRVQALDGLGRVPDYYAHMARLNRRGPRVLERLILPPELDPAAFEAAAAAGATIVDARDRDAFAASHIRGSLNIELASAFSGYVGWLVEFAAPVVLVLPDEPDALAAATTELLRVGYERIPGWLEGGIDAWAASGRPLASYGTTTMAEAQRRQASGEAGVLLDVRQANEWATGVVPGSETIFVADLPKRLDSCPTTVP